MVIRNVLKGKRMQLPINCDPVLAHVAAQCWAHHPDARPDFTSIVDKLGRRLQEVDEDNREAEHEVRAVEFMINGANVLKFPFVLKELNRGKKPQQRFVRLTSDLKSLLWRSFTANTVFSSARSKATERGINMSDVTGITEGQDTDNFRLFPTASSRRANSLSFSLITGDRTVDIQCESTGERNLWVWGLRFLLSRLRPSPRLQMVRMLVDEPHTLDTEDGLRDHLTAMRMVAYWLRRGELMIKYTSRKTHARHVCLSPDLTQILWGSEEDGPLRKGRNKSINLSDINSIVLGTQPRLISGSARVAAAAAQLADKLTFFRHPSTPLTVQNLSHNATARGKLTAESDELAFVQKPPKSANEKKHNSMRRHSVKSSVASVDDSLPLPALERRWSDDSHFSDTTLGSGAYHDESDYQLCVSYVAVDGRTLLALRCPNDDVLKIWSDGLAKLMMALRKCREDSGPEYNSASELAASSVENGGKWLNMKEYNVVVTPVSGAVAPRGKGVGSEYGELDDMSIGSASTVDVTDGASEKSGSHLSMGRKAAKKGFQPERRSVKRNHLGPLGEVAEETYVAMRAQSDWQVGEHGSWNDPALIPHRSEGKDQRKCDGTMLELKLSEDELDEIREMQRKGSETTVQSPYIAMPTSVGVVTAAGASRHVLNEPIGQERNHSTRDC
ncbi:unnamed protein product [Symbiodinium microadriaticum]|nr:unnamed protein product [Symbiodinium microadriaticum]